MRRNFRGFWIALGIIVFLVAIRLVIALTSPIRMVPVAGSPFEVPPGKGAAVALIVGLVALLLALVVGVGLALFDLGGRREEQAERFQTMISRALHRELGHVPVLPTAHVPRSSRSPVVVELTGSVPTAELRDAIVRVAEQEIARLCPDYRIDDRLGVDAAVTAAA